MSYQLFSCDMRSNKDHDDDKNNHFESHELLLSSCGPVRVSRAESHWSTTLSGGNLTGN
jgi:hypothetical protein